MRYYLERENVVKQYITMREKRKKSDKTIFYHEREKTIDNF